jgi:hypothetical protein
MFCCMVCWDLPALSLSCKIMSSDLQDLEDELAYDEASSCIEVGPPYTSSPGFIGVVWPEELLKVLLSTVP